MLLIAVELIRLRCINFISVKLLECYYGPLVRCVDTCWCYLKRDINGNYYYYYYCSSVQREQQYKTVKAQTRLLKIILYFFALVLFVQSSSSLFRDASPHRDLGVPPSRFVCYLWEEKVTVFGRKNRLNFRFRPEKAFRFRRRPFFVFFWRSPISGRKNRLNFRLRPEKAFEFRQRPFYLFIFLGDHLIFTEKLPQSNSETMKIWVKFVYGSTFQKSPLLCKILAKCLFFTKVQSTLKKRPPMQNFTI